MTPMAAVLTVLVALAEDIPEPDDVKAGWLGFAVFLLLAAAVVGLWFSFRKQLRKVDFEEKDEDAGPQDGGKGDATKP